MHKEFVKNFGEKELIKRLGQFMPAHQTSDDCAFITNKNNNLLINNDALVENVHFSDKTISPIDLGWKAVASNISDLLSSGSKKTIGITIGLIIPAKTEWIWIKELYKGINQALDHYGGVILGGDCSLGKEKVISITALGIQGELKLRRNACKPGDLILTTGIHGLSKLGFLIRSKNKFNDDVYLTEKLINNSIKQFCRPTPKTDLITQLLKTRTNNRIMRIGCTDSSDGLFQALEDLTTASNCKAIIDYEKLPRHKDWPKGKEWEKYYFFGGEDYEFIFSLPKKWAKNHINKYNRIKEIGYFTEGIASVEFTNSKRNKLLSSKPFSHF